jgi:hypothetical protein
MKKNLGKIIGFAIILTVLLAPFTASAAIAQDAVTAFVQSSDPTITISHTVTGTDTVLWLGAVAYGADDAITGATYNGVAMTQAYQGAQGSNAYIYLFYLVNPATGAHNAVISQSGVGTIDGVVASYTGARQTSVPEATGSATSTSASANVNVTTIADGSWGVGVVWTNRSNSNGTNGTIIGGKTSQFSMFDTNGALSPAGVYNMAVTMDSSSTWIASGMSFAPSASAAPIPLLDASFLMFE